MEPAEAVELLRKGDARVALSYHNLGAQGAEAIAEELKTNSTCTDLHMNGNAMGSDGAWALAEALKQNSTLTHLHLQVVAQWCAGCGVPVFCLGWGLVHWRPPRSAESNLRMALGKQK